MNPKVLPEFPFKLSGRTLGFSFSPVAGINGQRFHEIDFRDAATQPTALKMKGEKASIVIIGSKRKEKK